MTVIGHRGEKIRSVASHRVARRACVLLAAVALLGVALVRTGSASDSTHLSEASEDSLNRALRWEETSVSLDVGGFLGTPAPEAATTNAPIVATPLHEGLDLSTWGAPGDEPWSLQVLPDGLIYPSYLAGVREPRLGCAWNYDYRQGWMWDIALGGRAGLLRYGTSDRLRPQGWQVDLEGAAFPRLDLEHEADVVAADFRAGIPITYGTERFQTKLAFYHISSHLGDEYMVRYQTLSRINYSRNALVWGNSLFLTQALRLYGEAAWSFYVDGGAKPWEFQFGADYSPLSVNGLRGAPFVALNSYLRQEVNFGGNFVVQTGWQWRGESGQLFRMGMQYFAGASEQFEFYNRYESKVGLGLWYDF